MSLDFQQVQQQVRQLGAAALTRQSLLRQRMAAVEDLLSEYGNKLDVLQSKVQRVVAQYDASLRCALPVNEALNAHLPVPPLPEQATIIAADGSQIFMDRHAQVEYRLVNVGAIQMLLHSSQPPDRHMSSQLYFDEQAEAMSEAMLALSRDLNERKYLAELAEQAPKPVITFADGGMELWGARGESSEETQKFQESLSDYLEVLKKLHSLGVATAGYVDKPGADLVVRLLEIAYASESDLPGIRKYRPLRGIPDRKIFGSLLAPGERSAVFALQSQSIQKYAGPLALHFFYLNVGRRLSQTHIARVEIPAWVALNPPLLDTLHAVLVDQCRIMGERPYPYLLHRAHETAVVSYEDQEQVTQMIINELRRRGIEVEGSSFKQSAKDLTGRTRYSL